MTIVKPRDMRTPDSTYRMIASVAKSAIHAASNAIVPANSQ